MSNNNPSVATLTFISGQFIRVDWAGPGSVVGSLVDIKVFQSVSSDAGAAFTVIESVVGRSRSAAPYTFTFYTTYGLRYKAVVHTQGATGDSTAGPLETAVSQFLVPYHSNPNSVSLTLNEASAVVTWVYLGTLYATDTVSAVLLESATENGTYTNVGQIDIGQGLLLNTGIAYIYYTPVLGKWYKAVVNNPEALPGSQPEAGPTMSSATQKASPPSPPAPSTQTQYDIVASKRWLPQSWYELEGFNRISPSTYAFTSPTGNPLDTFHTLYGSTVLARRLPPATSASSSAPTATLTSFSFAGAQGSPSAQPTWIWSYGGGTPASYAWTVYGDANASPTTVLASGTTSITTYVYSSATVVNYYYKISVTATNSGGTGSFTDTQQSIATNISATGGTITTVSGIKYHKFTASGTFRVNANTSQIPVQIFAIGGGGGGGVCGGGGGGGAGVAVRASLIFDPAQTSQLGSYAVVIGAGGRGAYQLSPTLITAAEGGATTITNPSSQVISCQGGGVGASADFQYNQGNSQFATRNGGGACYEQYDHGPGSTLPTMGFPLSANITYYPSPINGGAGPIEYPAEINPAGGGGGGVASNGQPPNNETNGGNGGLGVTYAGVVYGAGGGGGGGNPDNFGEGSGTGGLAGGGAGGGGGNGATYLANYNVDGSSAAANTGSGGGGAYYIGPNYLNAPRGGSGGSGIAIFSYAVY
jgi:hypothetical protein